MNHPPEGRIMAIDYGTKRVGVAITDPLCIFPSITLTLNNDINLNLKLFNLIAEKHVGKIILGFPQVNNLKKSYVNQQILKFKELIENKTGILVKLWDEHYTSKLAESRVRESVVKKTKRQNKSLIDQQSAAIMLEEYLKSVNK